MITTFGPCPGGLAVYVDGKRVAMVRRDNLLRLIEEAAKAAIRDPYEPPEAPRPIQPWDV